jgi:hypothetical protein
MNEDEKNMYGVWIKGKGWLRTGNEPGKEFGDYSRLKAAEVAKLVGGVVRFIDQSLIDLEPEFLHKERQSLWVTFLNWYKRKINTLHSSKITKAS